MPVMKWLFIIIFIAVIAGCNTNESVLEPARTPNNEINLMKISKENRLDQHISNQAKDSMRKYAEITTAKAVNTDQKMIRAVEVDHNGRFKSGKRRKQQQNER